MRPLIESARWRRIPIAERFARPCLSASKAIALIGPFAFGVICAALGVDGERIRRRLA
jgi:hypothetical protein